MKKVAMVVSVMVLSSCSRPADPTAAVVAPTPTSLATTTPKPIIDPGARLALMKQALDACALCMVHMDGALAGPPFGVPVSKNTLYSLQFMKVVQKVDGGYLIQAGAPAGGDQSTELAYLKTAEDYPEDTVFMDIQKFVICTGTYEYQAMNGFSRKIWEFRPLPPEGNDYVMARMQAAMKKQQDELSAAH